MTTFWLAVAAGLTVLFIVIGAAAWLMWRRGDTEERALLKRVTRLSLRDKLHLGLALAREPRIPLLVRAIPPALALYLAMPLDVIPDFIPVIGHLDDALVLLLGVAVLLRFTPRAVLEEHVSRLEAGRGRRRS